MPREITHGREASVDEYGRVFERILCGAPSGVYDGDHPTCKNCRRVMRKRRRNG